MSINVWRKANPNNGSTFGSMHTRLEREKPENAPLPLMGHRNLISPQGTWQQALGASPKLYEEI